MFAVKSDPYRQFAITSSLNTSRRTCMIASRLNKENGSGTAVSEMPWPSSPMTFIVMMLAGGS